MGARIPIDEVEWDEENIEHVERHGVTWAEAHETLTNYRPRVIKPNTRPSEELRFFCFRRTDAGRFVTLIFAYRPETATARPFAAWDMKPSERGIHDREAPTETR